MQILVWNKIFKVRVYKISKEEEKFERNCFLQILVEMRKFEQLFSWSKIKDQLLVILFPSIASIIIVLFLIFVMLCMVKELKYELSKEVLLFYALLIVEKHACVVRWFVVWKEIKYLIQSIRSHRIILLSVILTNKLLKEFIPPQLIVRLQLLE